MQLRFNNMFFMISTIFWSNITVLFFFRVPFTISSEMDPKLRMYNDSVRKVYFHEVNVIIVEREKDTEKLLICQIASMSNERDQFLKSLDDDMGVAMELSFDDFWKLMTECDNCDEFVYLTVDTTAENIARKIVLSSSFLDALDGIVPGTFWCGKGNNARNYFDLGEDRVIDRCCRRHDLCPEKIKSKENKYNLFNDSLFTRCHCKCDEELARCLKETNRELANYISKIYFNLIGLKCIIDENGEKKFRDTKKFGIIC